ncbi:MAG: DUF934 domain-containing protein [Rhodospirillaceae bacterium]|jgi:uncharacterized protein (DUF934 family)|nr:DUF934 domain-containing protein [Rhodospirillaceae bacterium]MBT3492646.1 DUF934 domain-containing protein [Rhodospirillaceae bacterium]MBT3779659.1 DUF934 domain-containing protein [Rhodospirillaceae bacterium]MBT3975952.1 DUF934 domain-containing protein [Rhodospirillaceae bacterium]MBT4170611.1 DUF934 domain-containing protein [Rhodospirillaceae bacterium]
MPLIKHGRLVEDRWHETDDFAEVQTLAPLGPVIVSLDVWRQHKDAILAFDGPIGLRLAPGQTPDLAAADLHRFEVIALEFATFTDGRAYSQARLLRQRHGYKGELRAVGEVLRDQLTFMLRCGFDSFSLATAQQAQALLEAVEEFAHWYQPALDGRATIPALRRGSGEKSSPVAAGCAATWAY